MKGPEDPYVFDEVQKPTPARGKGRGKGRGKKAQTADGEFLIEVGDKCNKSLHAYGTTCSNYYLTINENLIC